MTSSIFFSVYSPRLGALVGSPECYEVTSQGMSNINEYKITKENKVQQSRVKKRLGVGWGGGMDRDPNMIV